jgi:uncharacterized DUF497 family protein
MNYYFEWDPRKAAQNVRKHDVTFQRAATVFSDPNLLSLFDEIHSSDEERWVTIGMDHSGNVLIVAHTFEALGAAEAKLRIISARRATPAEIDAYEQHFQG